MSVINDFLSLIYPRHCEACSRNLYRHEAHICNHCRINLPRSNYHKQAVSPMHMTFAGRVPLIMACSYFLYEKSGKVQKLLHAIKYQEQQELARYLGRLYAEDLQAAKTFAGVDLILPVPLHKNKLKIRGFNQSEEFAKGLAQGLQKDMSTHHLNRVMDTKTQTRKKKYERWENVDGIFQVQEAGTLYGKHILLVDDVVTTGATIEASWQALKQIEDVKVSLVSIAFADRQFN
jgi:ComF family protein